MSQHDFEIANQGFPSFRSDLNSALQALASNSAGTSEPSTTFAYQFWYDSTANLLKFRNADNDAWITLAFFDQTNDEWEVRTAVIQAVDSAGVVIKTDDGTTRITVADNGNVTIANNFTVTGTTTLTDDLNVDSDTLFVDASANAVGIGTSSPSTYGKLVSSGGKVSLVTDTATERRVSFWSTANGNSENAYIQVQNDGATTNTGEILFATKNSGGTLAERMRIDSSGNLLVGTTGQLDFGAATASGVHLGTNFLSASRSGNGSLFLQRSGSDGTIALFFRDTAIVGQISVTTTGTTYATSSDYRLKENVVDMTDAIDRVKALKPSRFNFITDPDTTVDGFLAHEAQEIVPESVTGEKDAMRTEEYVVERALGEIYVPATEAVLDENGNVITEAQDEQIVSSDVEKPETLEDGQQWRETTPAVMGEREVPDYQGIDQAKLVPLLTGALKEAIAKIEALEARVTALES